MPEIVTVLASSVESVSRLALRSRRATVTYAEAEGFGFTERDRAGEDIFVQLRHFNVLVTGPTGGQRVFADMLEGGKRPAAVKIRLI